MKVTFVFPERSEDEVSEGLRTLTAALCEHLDESGAGGLGGSYGYGANYENAVFSMHRYCWCDGHDCPWCSYSDEHGQYFQERFRAFGAEPGMTYAGAPNFWHKPSGIKVWWYKWIGRDMEVSGEGFAEALRECLASIPSPPTQEQE